MSIGAKRGRLIILVPRSFLGCSLLTLPLWSPAPAIAIPNFGQRETGSPATPAFRGAPNNGSVRVPFDLYGNNILIQVRVNDSPPVWFVFDSGASINVINE